MSRKMNEQEVKDKTSLKALKQELDYLKTINEVHVERKKYMKEENFLMYIATKEVEKFILLLEEFDEFKDFFAQDKKEELFKRLIAESTALELKLNAKYEEQKKEQNTILTNNPEPQLSNDTGTEQA